MLSVRQASWRVPAGARPAQVRRSSRLVVSVACCVVEGDDHCEGYTTIVWGRLLSRERYDAAEAEAVDRAEGNMCGPVMRGSIAQPWSKTLSRTKGTGRNLGVLAFGRAVSIAPVRMGKVMSRSL